MTAKIYTRAAERISDNRHRYCCISLVSDLDVDAFDAYLSVEEFCEIFRPRNRKKASSWFDFEIDAAGKPSKTNQLARSLALLLMAEIVKEK